MTLAGVPVPSRDVLVLARRLDAGGLEQFAWRLREALVREVQVLALEIGEREALMRVLEDCPEGLAELHATLLREDVARRRDGLT
jgi:hypothetical protein